MYLFFFFCVYLFELCFCLGVCRKWDCWILWLSDSDEGVASLLSGRYFYICLANITLWFCLCPCHGNWFGLELSLPALQFISITAHHCLSYLFNARPGGSSRKESVCNAGDPGGMYSFPGLGRSLEKGMATHSSILA